MPFLLPNQQRQSTEGNTKALTHHGNTNVKVYGVVTEVRLKFKSIQIQYNSPETYTNYTPIYLTQTVQL